MAENKSLVEEAIIQMKNLEEAVAENAKGILASTMKQEIRELVKESLSEQEDETEVDVDTEEEMDVQDDMSDDIETDDFEDEMNSDDDTDNFDMDDFEDEMNSDDETINLTNATDDEIIKVFKAMSENDGIIVKKDGGNVKLKDENADVEYLISLGESVLSEETLDSDNYNFKKQNNMKKTIDQIFQEEMDKDMYESYEEEDEAFHDEEDEGEVVYEIEMDDEDESYEEQTEAYHEEDEEDEEIVYEIEMDDEIEMDEEYEEDESYQMESKFMAKPVMRNHTSGKAKAGFKNAGTGFKESMPHGINKKGVGNKAETGDATKYGWHKHKQKLGGSSENWGGEKITPKPGANLSNAVKKENSAFSPKKAETKEASRTLGAGQRWGRKGLDKPVAAPRNLRTENIQDLKNEINVLREKNEEYRKALNIFRTKLDEVAVFNANLAYATRLFTEHSTTKQEKLNILKRFDGVENLKESKNLYKTIREEISSKGNNNLTESIETKLNKSQESGSASNLIESKTYENPQFLRTKELMSKLLK